MVSMTCLRWNSSAGVTWQCYDDQAVTTALSGCRLIQFTDYRNQRFRHCAIGACGLGVKAFSLQTSSVADTMACAVDGTAFVTAAAFAAMAAHAQQPCHASGAAAATVTCAAAVPGFRIGDFCLVALQ